DGGMDTARGGGVARYQLPKSLPPNDSAYPPAPTLWRAGAGQNRRQTMSFGQRTSGTRNRRLSNVRQRRQQHLLDVKVRSRRATQHRVRSAMGLVWRVGLFVIFCAAAYAGGREAVRRLFFENPDYHVQTIELQTDGTLQREQVLKAADLHEGANIFSVNLASVRDRIQQLPQADEVEVVRKLPSEIDIRM